MSSEIDLAHFDPRSVDIDAQLLALDVTDCEESLYEFLKRGWRYIDPAAFKENWAVDAICEHLQAVVDGQIKRLLINCPPRIGKSNCVSVALPAWTWAQPVDSPTSGPGVPFLYASHKDTLSLRDSVKCRRLIESPWYQARWGHRFKLASDQNTKSRFSNDKGGERLITSIDAGVTGEGGNIICIDDPNSAKEVASQVELENVIDWWTQAMPTRANDLETCGWIIIQQRLAQDDLSGHVLDQEGDDGWVHLCLPGEYEPERSFSTLIGWKDPRTQPGELLWPERFSDEVLRRLKKRMGPYIYAGQIQQRPEPKGGGIIKRDWWQTWNKENFPPMSYVIAWLDTAYTEEEMNDPSGMIIWGIFYDENPNSPASRIIGIDGKPFDYSRTSSVGAPKVMCIHAWSERYELHDLVRRTAEECVKYKVDDLHIENKAAGHSVAQEIQRLYTREKFGVILEDPGRQDKMARLISVQHLFAEGIIHGPDTKWMDAVITQLAQFPKAKGGHDEYVDCTSGGLKKLRDMGLLIRAPEREAEIEADKMYKGRIEPLYAV